MTAIAFSPQKISEKFFFPSPNHSVFKLEMDPPSESYRHLLRLFHTDQHFLQKLSHTLTMNSMKLAFSVKASPLVILRVYPILTISPVGVSGSVRQVIKTMTEHPELLGESLVFFFFFGVARGAHGPGFHPVPLPSQAPWLTRLPNHYRGVYLPLRALPCHRCYRCLSLRYLGLGEDHLLPRYLSWWRPS